MEHKILVVDDDIIIRDAIAEYLQLLGYKTDTAENVKVAVALLHTLKYDIVITEINMPRCSEDYSGRYLLNHIYYRYPWTKTIVVTGDASIETGLEAIHLGASYWLTKPFSLSVLKNRISIIIGLNNIRTFAAQRKSGAITCC